jgi:hypothetical protein
MTFTVTAWDDPNNNLVIDPGESVLATNSITVPCAVDEPPVLPNLPDITVDATSPSGATVTFGPVSATDKEEGTIAAVCTPASGSTFPIGTTEVTCSATDHAATTTATFHVIVTVPTSKDQCKHREHRDDPQVSDDEPNERFDHENRANASDHRRVLGECLRIGRKEHG